MCPADPKVIGVRLALLEEIADAAERFRELVIRQMYADGFPEKASADLCELLVRKLQLERERVGGQA